MRGSFDSVALKSSLHQVRRRHGFARLRSVMNAATTHFATYLAGPVDERDHSCARSRGVMNAAATDSVIL
ncbi:MAG: hypothetical protein M3Z24_16995 [Chloroflexota bacterium]|nr:hypothetical protein [Chloroflexota bacterium]